MIEQELKATSLFAQVKDEAVARAAALGVTEVEPGQVLAQAGDPGSGMYVVLDGEVVVELHGRQVAIGPGGFFGELSLLVPGGERIARVRASTPARLVCVARPTFDFLLETEPSFATALLRELAARFVDTARTHD